MVDVMVLSVLSMQVGDSDSRFPVPIHRWAEVIERGLQKEEEYKDKIAELEAAIDATRDTATKAELQALLAKEKEAIAKAEAERMRAAREEAEKQAEAAIAAAQQAEVEARSKAAEKEVASEEAARARTRREEALTQALEAEKAASAAKERAMLAQKELETKLNQIAEIKTREAEMLKKARQAENRARMAEAREKTVNELMNDVRERLSNATEQERKYAEMMAKAEAAKAKIEGEAEVYEKELAEAKQNVEATRDEVTELTGKVVGLSAAEKAARKDLERVAEEKTELATKLGDIEREKEESVWVRRDKSIKVMDINMVEKDVRSENDEKQKELYLPLLQLGGKTVMVSEYETLELDWWEIQVDRNIIKLLFTINAPGSDDKDKMCRAFSMMYEESEPRILYLPFNCDGSDFETLKPIGMGKLKEERIQNVLLFKAGEPDKATRVKITPLLRENYLSVRDIEPSSDVDIRPGDYLLTERGQFVGVMVTRDKCYVVPAGMPSEDSMRGISLIKSPQQEYYEAFVSGARKLKDKVKEMTKDSFWF